MVSTGEYDAFPLVLTVIIQSWVGQGLSRLGYPGKEFIGWGRVVWGWVRIWKNAYSNFKLGS